MQLEFNDSATTDDLIADLVGGEVELAGAGGAEAGELE